jgi:hypothetical protein
MKKNVLRNVPPEKVDELDKLRQQVAHAEAHDQHGTVHHEMLQRLESELGLIPNKKETRETPSEVNNDGKQDS